jgi:hypothetical protein
MATAELGGRPEVQNPPSVKMALLGNPATVATHAKLERDGFRRG